MRRLPPLLLACAGLAVPVVATATTTQSSTDPAVLRQQVDSGAYAKSLATGWAKASAALKAELAKKPRAAHPAVVLDIDETSLSNAACLEAANFALAGLADCAVNEKGRAIPGALAFDKQARAAKVRVFFVTGSPEQICAKRKVNLKAQGFPGSPPITCQSATDLMGPITTYKTAARTAIEKAGNTILVNVGDQASDLAGGHAKRTVKLPNPFYTTT